MSILWGLLRKRHAPLQESELQELSLPTRRYGTAETGIQVRGRVGMGIQSYLSHIRSGMDSFPQGDGEGNLLCWDGRLDNIADLVDQLGLEALTADSSIVLAAFRRWGEECFAYLTGDWALSLWCEDSQTLFLARDHAGTRSLYFSQQNGQTLWATYLDTFLPIEKDRPLSPEYARRYLSCLPVRDYTAFEEIRSVLPGHYVMIHETTITQRRHWTPIPATSILYQNDAEYEEHFRALFGQSVSRRTGDGAPIVAQLSGGMDSTSIVCMSDDLRRTASKNSSLLDTVSYFDDSESTLDERTYFEITERYRGKVGIHVNAAFSQRTFRPHDPSNGVYLFPGADSFAFEQERLLDSLVWSRGYRSVLSGIGGDEVLGGVPNGDPELANYLVSLQLGRLARQSMAWSLAGRKPILSTLGNALRYLHRSYLRPASHRRKTPSWLKIATMHAATSPRATVSSLYSRRCMPTAVDNAESWWSILETLPHLQPQILCRPEYRYPFLDKDLVEYLFSIPREQILRPGQRRSLMRRALAHIMPAEILERRQKAYQLRAPLKAISDAESELQKLFVQPRIEKLGFVDVPLFRQALSQVGQGEISEWHGIVRVIAYELWLRSTGNPHCT